MKIDDMTISQISKLVNELSSAEVPPVVGTPAKASPGHGYVIARCSGAGVHAGYVVSVDYASATVFLKNSRRLWRWWSKFTLSELALYGPREDKVSECKFSAEIPDVVTLRDWCELLPCTAKAEEAIRAVPSQK